MSGCRGIWWPRLLVIIAAACRTVPSLAAQPEHEPAARRLELAAALHDGVEPEAIAADRSRWRQVANADARPVVVPTSDVIRWGEVPPWPTGPTVLLADGGVLAGRIVAADERTIVVDTATFGPLTLPSAAVRGWRVSPAIGPGPLAEVRTSGGRPTRLLLANGDRVTARRVAWRDGTLSVTPEAGRAEGPASGAVTIPAAVLRAVDFAVSEPSRPVTSGLCILVAVMDGSRFAIAALEPAPAIAGAARVRLALRLPEAAVAVACDADEILAVAVDGGRAGLLAPRDPAAYEQTPVLGPAWPLARGRTLTGDWPSLRGATAFSALGIHSAAAVRYRLDEPATRFRARVAIDDSAATGGSVVVRVVAGDPGHPGREVFSSGVIRGGEPPVRIDTPLPAATEVQLVVEPAGGGDVLDRTLWLDPLVLRQAE
jgi:hypothetical protein